MVTKRQILATVPAVILLAVSLAAAALAAGPDRAYQLAQVPVQNGFAPDATELPPYHPARILVKFRPDAQGDGALDIDHAKGTVVPGGRTGIASVDAVCAAAGVKQISRPWIEVRDVGLANELGIDRWYLLETDGASDPHEVAHRLARDPNVEEATVDWLAFPAVVPNDPLHSMHWGHNNTAQLLSYNWSTNRHEDGSPVGTVGFDANAHAAWDAAQGFGNSGVVIAIIDSGVEAGHPDLLQVTGYDFGDNDSNPDDNSSQRGHGTACAGVAAARNNTLGSAGIAAACSIMPLKVANSAGSMYFSAIQNALYYAADHGAHIISMSLGAAISSDSATDTAILYAYNAGCTILAATGNENKSTISYPAIHANVIAVGAASPCGERKRSSSNSAEVNPGVSTDPNGYTCDGERWWGSNYGVATAGAAGAVDVIAPTILPTTDLLGSDGYDASDYSKWFNGTSCATPYAAGVCALIKAANPTFTPAQITARLTSTAQDVVSVESGAGWDRYSGYGMVDAAAAVAGSPPPTDAVTVTYPNGGETLTAGTSVNITWTWTGSFTTVALDYSLDGGANWTVITSSTANDGSEPWTLPSNATTQGRVRVRGGTATDTSNANFTIVLPSGDYATLPYTTGFEATTLDQYWTTAVTADGRVRILTTNTPHSGSRHLVMDDGTSGGYSQTEARLRLNLSGQTQVNLSFWWKDFGDETHTQDGIYFSSNGGTSYVKVYSLNPGSYSNNVWRQVTLDLDALAAANGLTLTSTFVVKFQQYDDYPITTDGMAFDDIAVTIAAGGGSAITAETEPNNTSGTANGPVGTGVAVSGAISSSSDDDYFYFDVATAGNINISLSIGGSADLDWFLYNSSMTQVARGYTTANPEVGNYNAAVGRYYLFVDGYNGATSSYTLTVSGGLAQIAVSQEKGAPPAIAVLHQNHPNPFNPATTIRFELAAKGPVALRVYDLRGQLVATLVDEERDAGSHSVMWNGLGDHGHRVNSGVYFYRIEVGDYVATRKFTLLK